MRTRFRLLPRPSSQTTQVLAPVTHSRQSAIGGQLVKWLIPSHIPASFLIVPPDWAAVFLQNSDLPSNSGFSISSHLARPIRDRSVIHEVVDSKPHSGFVPLQPSPKGGRGRRFNLTLPSPLAGEGPRVREVMSLNFREAH